MIGARLSVLEVLATDSRHDVSEIAPGLAGVARAVEDEGYDRIWYAEHHHSASLVDFPPAVMGAHIAAATRSIRVGSGGVLALNHTPLLVGEQFRALERLHPGRIDIGIGRGPGTFDPSTVKALRRGGESPTDGEYRLAVEGILDHVRGGPTAPAPWLLASSESGAALAASLGLPVAFADHIRPDVASAAIDRYRTAFTPSAWATTPRVMVSVQTVCADTEERAAAL